MHYHICSTATVITTPPIQLTVWGCVCSCVDASMQIQEIHVSLCIDHPLPLSHHHFHSHYYVFPGQNFLDEDNQNTLNSESQAKRLKIALAGSHQDQVMCRIEF